MEAKEKTTPINIQGATVIISHRVLIGKEKKYEEWLEVISSYCRAANGFLDWQVIKPIPNLTVTYTFIIRFNSEINLQNWMNSFQRSHLIQEISDSLESGDQYDTRNGLDFLFSFETQSIKPPLRWKQFLITWSAIFPLVNIVPIFILPALRYIIPYENRLLDSFFISACIVYLMVFVIMPKYTSLIRTWLYKRP
ncbi:antibiotic biosynthesis monooxygenase [Leptospira sp. 85282-16]|uniref:Antibiotic biosynthesis monooxygenase n=1 Tax=Leptospira montravelensis TaxID=2484961 RepID=A0ABY2LUK3_9LEPT|nr:MULTISPECIES: antibiotic biosynthesis monooxygenase [Leptospira]MCT8335072.1 antibiotic biosynthesis monooxygenase [Leptospira sp. 85282-16]TGK78680.1 antibiotic biosynthesis monooxygenase [Leptospira montravelensis]TGL02384.1 antibiotic biosynthesis monooxygenase [Leptospira montravelensis]